MRSARAMETGQSQCAMCIGPGVAEFSLFVLLPSTFSLSSASLPPPSLCFIAYCIGIITLLAIPFYCLYSSRPYSLSQIYST
jgi:hypothetical protein